MIIPCFALAGTQRIGSRSATSVNQTRTNPHSALLMLTLTPLLQRHRDHRKNLPHIDSAQRYYEAWVGIDSQLPRYWLRLSESYLGKDWSGASLPAIIFPKTVSQTDLSHCWESKCHGHPRHSSTSPAMEYFSPIVDVNPDGASEQEECLFVG